MLTSRGLDAILIDSFLYISRCGLESYDTANHAGGTLEYLFFSLSQCGSSFVESQL